MPRDISEKGSESERKLHVINKWPKCYNLPSSLGYQEALKHATHTHTHSSLCVVNVKQMPSGTQVALLFPFQSRITASFFPEIGISGNLQNDHTIYNLLLVICDFMWIAVAECICLSVCLTHTHAWHEMRCNRHQPTVALSLHLSFQLISWSACLLLFF